MPICVCTYRTCISMGPSHSLDDLASRQVRAICSTIKASEWDRGPSTRQTIGIWACQINLSMLIAPQNCQIHLLIFQLPLLLPQQSTENFLLNYNPDKHVLDQRKFEILDLSPKYPYILSSELAKLIPPTRRAIERMGLSHTTRQAVE